ncbi:MAG TPA: DNA topoisomerase 3 [Solirubrobacteraceae bacterium]|jgi:DNA topoisomerase-3|nr:DNA topoisomerase 3 [Solirubrobacteraceae bacterium]
MSKTLVIAEKPSVGRDLARVLPGTFKKEEGWLEAEEYIVTWAVGHLVQLAEPDEYDAKYKRWRIEDLPIVPERFKLVVRDERSRKQMSVVTRQLSREDVGEVINACDAGREGELIFAYIYEKAGSTLPVRRLWLNSMTNSAMKAAFASLRPASEVALLEQAARSRSESDWIVGMNATRAATIRLRTSFDGAVSLGRVQTPTLAIVTRREEEIKAFVPEPYWLVDAVFAAPPLEGEGEGEGSVAGDPAVAGGADAGGVAGEGSAGGGSAAGGGAENGDGGLGEGGEDGEVGVPGERVYVGRFHAGAKPRLATEEEAVAIVEACEGKQATITKIDVKEQRERAPMLYDLTSLQRDANTRFGFSARRTLGAAQRLYEEHKALTYPRTNSRYLTTDMIPEIKPTAELVGANKDYAAGAAYVTSLDVLPLGRVVNDAKVTDHHAIIPTRTEHKVDRMSDDDRRVYDLAVRRFLAVFHPEAVFENTRVETTIPAAGGERAGKYVFRTRGKLLIVPGWRGVYGQGVVGGEQRMGDEDEGTDQLLPRLIEGEHVQTREIKSLAKETKPPRRYSDASLLGAMETAGKLVDDDELREAMKESGIGTPATRAAIIERLITVGYIERDGRSLVATEKGLNVVRLLGRHPLTSPELTGRWEHRLDAIERGEDSREHFMKDIAGFAGETVKMLDEALKDVRIPKATLGPCPICGHPIVENRKGYSCWARNDPGCGFVIWKSKAGKTLPLAVARELIHTGYTARPVSGFKGRSGRSFRSHLALQQTPDGKWRVEFNEAWAKSGAKPPDHETVAGEPAAEAPEQVAAEAVAAVADS